MMARVLIIDDDPTVSVLLKSLLIEKRADEVRLLDDATRALRYNEDLRPDVILIACSVAGVDALAVADQLRARGPVPIVLYGIIAPRDAPRYASLAATVAHLLPPISPDELLAARDAAIE
jgi:CheY-like chemotaxis protein